MLTSHQTINQVPEWQRLGFVPGLTLRAFGMRRSGDYGLVAAQGAAGTGAVSKGCRDFAENCGRQSDDTRGLVIMALMNTAQYAPRNNRSLPQGPAEKTRSAPLAAGRE